MSSMKSALILLTLGMFAAGEVVAAQEQHEHAPTGRLGTVHFVTSCGTAVSKDFDRGIAMLHSFWFSAAIEAFNGVLKADPACTMAHWGIAMSWWGNPFGGFRSPQALQNGQAAIEKAKAAAAKTERERAYLAAVEALYHDFATVDQRSRTLAYEKAMEQLAAKYPDDPEARIFYALSLDQTALPTDKTYANQLKAAAILEKEFARQPEHPGITHYIIHSFDVPVLAPRALSAARRYAKLAPAVPHALHMPSHTFTRVGSWQESIDTNIASAIAARKDGAASEELHALDYQVYAYLQTAQDAAARKSMDEISSIGDRIQVNAPGAAAPAPAGFFALAAIPARYALERDAWAEAARLTPRESPFPWTEAITYFARAIGAARTKDTAAAQADVEKLATLRDGLRKAKDAYWSEQVEIQRQAAAAWVALAQGRTDEALTLAREAADIEDATEKSAVTPGPIKPARELLGDMLLELRRPADALREFETAMKKEPNRFRTLYGAARAAEATGDRRKARDYSRALMEICQRADKPGRTELQQMRKIG
jgi:hypothetical protein